jgi:hypothetical protein
VSSLVPPFTTSGSAVARLISPERCRFSYLVHKFTGAPNARNFRTATPRSERHSPISGLATRRTSASTHASVLVAARSFNGSVSCEVRRAFSRTPCRARS